MTPRTVFFSLLLLCLTASAQFGLRSPAFVGNLQSRSQGDVPSVPTSLFVTDSDPNFFLGWDAGIAGNGYELVRNADGGGFTIIKTGPYSEADFTDTGVTVSDSHDYLWKIRATNSFGASAYSSTVGLSRPSGIIATGFASGIIIRWTDNSGNETGFKSQGNYVGDGWIDNPNGGDSDANPTAADATSYFGETASLGLSDQYQLCSLQIRVRSENATGISTWSTVTQVAPSIVIANLDAVLSIGVGVTLSWSSTDEIGGNNLTHIYRSINSGGYTDIGSVTGDTGTYSDNTGAVITAIGLAQPVLYKVRNQNDGGNAPYSNIATSHP